MTTVAYRNGTLAADTLATCNGMVDGYGAKIWRVGPVLVGGCGSRAECLGFRDWVAGGMKGDPKLTETNCLLVSREHLVCWSEKGCWPVTEPFYALGSGYEVAIGAMAAGATAKRAVQLAARYDTRTGGEITVLRLH